MVYFQTDYLLLEYHAASHVLLSQWYGRCSSLQYRQALIKLVRLIRDLNVPYAITDSRLLSPSTLMIWPGPATFTPRPLASSPLNVLPPSAPSTLPPAGSFSTCLQADPAPSPSKPVSSTTLPPPTTGSPPKSDCIALRLTRVP